VPAPSYKQCSDAASSLIKAKSLKHPAEPQQNLCLGTVHPALAVETVLLPRAYQQQQGVLQGREEHKRVAWVVVLVVAGAGQLWQQAGEEAQSHGEDRKALTQTQKLQQALLAMAWPLSMQVGVVANRVMVRVLCLQQQNQWIK
jgi:hypothetical protein